MGDAEAKLNQPLVKRSRREYEVIMVVDPGKTLCGVAVGAVNPDGKCSFVTGRDKWANLQRNLKYVDLFVGSYQNLVEEATAIEMVDAAQKAGCETRLIKNDVGVFTPILPTRPQRAQGILENLLHPRGITTYRDGMYRREHFEYMLPRIGEKL